MILGFFCFLESLLPDYVFHLLDFILKVWIHTVNLYSINFIQVWSSQTAKSPLKMLSEW